MPTDIAQAFGDHVKQLCSEPIVDAEIALGLDMHHNA
jgi:hypothetical protein